MSVVQFSDLQAIIAREFGVPPDSIARETTADDVDGWDSIAHAGLIMNIEAAFSIRFDNDEIYAFPDVGAMFDRIVELAAATGA